jgi:hypothetical protein
LVKNGQQKKMNSIALTRQKIDRLLLLNANGLDNECMLVALVLWVRIQPQLAADQVLSFWESHHRRIVPWMLRLLEPQKQHALQKVYVRLVAQLVKGTCRAPAEATTAIWLVPNHILEPIGAALLAIWDQRTLQPWDAGYDSDLLAGLYTYLVVVVADQSSSSNWDRNELLLRQLVERLSYCSSSALLSPTTRSVENDNDSTKHASTHDDDDGPLPASTVMVQTLTALLDQDSRQHSTLTESVDRIGFVDVFLQQRSDERMPLFWAPLLEWWVQSSSGNSGAIPSQQTIQKAKDRLIWGQILLLVIQRQTSSVSFAVKEVLRDDKVGEQWSKFLLTCVGGRSQDCSKNDDLRVLAWSTSASIIFACGWDWLMVSSSSSSSSIRRHDKAAPKLCAFLRIAAGEWKIQLGWLVTTESETKTTASRIRTVQACARILTQGLHYVTQIADQMDNADDDLLLSVDAILHIRKSLQEALDAAVQFFGLIDSADTGALANNVEVQEVAALVLGTLISEMDVFTVASSKDSEGENEALHALAVALTCQATVEAQEYLLPGLATVFASCEGDEERLTLLNDYEIVGKSLDDFLQAYFERTINLDTFHWACQLIDLWTVLAPPATRHSELLEAILLCLEKLVAISKATPGTNALGPALSCVATCYITLQGEDPPGERQAELIKQALEMSACM